MNKKVLLIAAVMSMFVFSLQIAEPASAAKLKVVDHGSLKFHDTSSSTATYKWTTYQKGVNYVEIKGYYYFPKYKFGEYYYIYLKKVSKTKIKITQKLYCQYSDGKHFSQNLGSYYDHTKLTAAQYYWREYRPLMIKYP